MKRIGPHPDKALSPVKVRALKTPGRHADGNGLYLVVDPSGAKRWLLRTVVQGKRTDIGLGSIRLVSLAQAREEAARLRGIARSGKDPLAARQAENRITPTFESAATTVYESHTGAWRNGKHKKQWLDSLEKYVFPVFGKKQVSAVTSADIMQALTPIWISKAETARRILQRIRSTMDWAKAAGYCQGDNPVIGLTKALPKQTGKRKHHAALPYSEVPEFIQKLHQSDAGISARLAFEFAILTACRTNEVIGAKRLEIDFEKKSWTIPADRMKAGREHRVPLTDRCLEVAKLAFALDRDNEYVFPGRVSKKPLSNMALLMILRRMKIAITAHGFRSSFRDWAAEQTNFPTAVCEAALAHTIKDKVEAAYHRTDLFARRRELMEHWSRYCTGSNQ